MDLFRRLFHKNTKDDQEKSDSDERLVKTTELPDLPAAIPPESPQTRPLTPPETFRNPSRQIHYGIASDVGRERTNNQDGALTIVTNPELIGNPPSIALFVVADGMGGHHDGEHASAVTVQTIAKQVFNEIVLPQMEGAELSADQKTIPEVLADSFEAANRAVQIAVPDGGTTATCVVIRGNLAYVAHVGDSRAYLIADGNMELITRDHSLVRRLQELGQLTAEEAAVHPQRNVLYRAIGQGDSLEVDAATRRLPPSSLLLLCSDGLWGVLGDDRMAEIMMDANDPQDACDQMVKEANDLGGPDNITVLLVQMPD